MRLESTIAGDVTVFKIIGELNGDSKSKLNAAVSKAFGEQRRDCVLDLSEVTVVDSAGLEQITAIQRQCEEELGMARVCGADETLRKIFEMTRLNRQFEMFDSVDEALASLAQGQVGSP